MGATSKRARVVRRRAEFSLASLLSRVLPPRGANSVFSWSYDDIISARDAQMRGCFARPVRLAEAMRTDDALFVPYQNRLAPQRGLPVTLTPPKQSAAAMRVLGEADALYGEHGVGLSVSTLSDINGYLANHGVAVGVNVWTPRLDGARVDVEMHTWPLEHVRWDPIRRCLVTRVDPESARVLDLDPLGDVPIVHGDGRWVVFSAHEHEPWRQEAAVLAAWSIWLRHAHGIRDWAKGARASGNTKIVAELPEGVSLQSADGTPSVDAQAMLDLATVLASDELPVGVRPAGSKTEILANGSSAWQVFHELVKSGEISGARLYLGQDGTLGTNATGPGVDLRALFGVRNDLVESDLHTIEHAIFTGVIQPWAAWNFGESTLAPRRVYQIPDADEDARRTSMGEMRAAFYSAIERERALGFDVTPARIAALAADYGVSAAALAAEGAKAPTIALAPTDLARVVKVNEARASAGLGPLTIGGMLDPDGELTVEEFSAKKAAAAATRPPSGMVRAAA